MDNVYTRTDDQLTLTTTDAEQISEDPREFKTLIAQADFDNGDVVRIGGADPQLVLQPGASQTFYNGFLNQIFWKGTIGYKLNIHVEY